MIRTTTLLVPRHKITSYVRLLKVLLSVFQFSLPSCSSALRLKLPVSWLFQVCFSRNADEQGGRGNLKERKEEFGF
ncbi:hypothetical protein [Bacteroides sp.]|uniref:hypothetical protein n=1 Tax=Bacteroides sp. TaxID=29523 RepID=UPI003A932F9A